MSRKRTLSRECFNKHFFSLNPQTYLVIIIKPGLQMMKQTQKGGLAWPASHSWEIIEQRLTPLTVFFPLLTLDLENDRCGHLPSWGGEMSIPSRRNQESRWEAWTRQVVQHSWSTGSWEENRGWKSVQSWWIVSQIRTSFHISGKATEAFENFVLG